MTPAALRSTSASAIWDTTNPLSGLRAVPAILRERNRRISSMAVFFARNAGINPKTSAVKIELVMAKSNTRQSTCTSSARGSRSGQKRRKIPVPRTASKSPSEPPQMPSTLLSIKHWRNRRPVGAPKATRNANSCPRETTRVNRRLATLTHAISRTRLTALRSSHRVGLTSWTSSLCSGCGTSVMATFESGYCFASRALISANSA